jgi:hypothetical protein
MNDPLERPAPARLPILAGHRLYFQRIALNGEYIQGTVTVTSARRDGLASRNYGEEWSTWHGRADITEDGPPAIVQATGPTDGRPEYWTVKGWLDDPRTPTVASAEEHNVDPLPEPGETFRPAEFWATDEHVQPWQSDADLARRRRES